MATTITGITPTPWSTTVGLAARTAGPVALAGPATPFPGPANRRRPSLHRLLRRVGDLDGQQTTTTSPAPIEAPGS